jgi:hypothetical protein
MQLPDFEIALSNVELKKDSVIKKIVRNSEIIILYSKISKGYIMFLYNPEQSQRGLNGTLIFDLVNLSIKNYSSN